MIQPEEKIMIHQPHEYLHLRAWSIRLASFDNYIHQQQEIAAMDNAPLNAIYRDVDGTWITFIPNPQVKLEVEGAVRWLWENDVNYYPPEMTKAQEEALRDSRNKF